jgi:hypothetical protein
MTGDEGEGKEGEVETPREPGLEASFKFGNEIELDLVWECRFVRAGVGGVLGDSICRDGPDDEGVPTVRGVGFVKSRLGGLEWGVDRRLEGEVDGEGSRGSICDGSKGWPDRRGEGSLSGGGLDPKEKVDNLVLTCSSIEAGCSISGVAGVVIISLGVVMAGKSPGTPRRGRDG